MRNDQYPSGTVRSLLQTDFVTPPTRRVLQERLEQEAVMTPRFFDLYSFVTLGAVCARLIPQPKREKPVDLAGLLDEQLATSSGNGWRYDEMPPDNQAFRNGLVGVEQTAKAMFGKPFQLLNAMEQNKVLRAIQAGEASGATWQIIPARLFFEELLAVLVELYYSHPLAQEEIGEVAMADAKGWRTIGLNERQAPEPEALNEGYDAQ